MIDVGKRNSEMTKYFDLMEKFDSEENDVKIDDFIKILETKLEKRYVIFGCQQELRNIFHNPNIPNLYLRETHERTE